MTPDADGASKDRLCWRDLVERRQPDAAWTRSDWLVRFHPCFAHILLDNVCGQPWRQADKAPAWRNMPADRLGQALALGEAVLAGADDLAALNARSLALRGKRPPC